jgi:hypothetical protein
MIVAAAHRLVEALLEGGRLPSSDNPMAIKLQAPDGSVVDAEFSGYYTDKLRNKYDANLPSIGYPDNQGGMTHGMLRSGWHIITPLPPPEDYEAQRASGGPTKASEEEYEVKQRHDGDWAVLHNSQEIETFPTRVQAMVRKFELDGTLRPSSY